MVLISTLESIYCTVTRVPISPGDRFGDFDRMVSMKEPLLIVHGKIEKAIPTAYGNSLVGLLPSVGN